MKIKASQITEWAHSNGIPCHGDLFETVVNGEKYRAEFYATADFGSEPYLCLAADSYIEKYVDGKWEKMIFPETKAGDDAFSELLAQITPELENDL